MNKTFKELAKTVEVTISYQGTRGDYKVTMTIPDWFVLTAIQQFKDAVQGFEGDDYHPSKWVYDNK
jgi:hypothetical protein